MNDIENPKKRKRLSKKHKSKKKLKTEEVIEATKKILKDKNSNPTQIPKYLPVCANTEKNKPQHSTDFPNTQTQNPAKIYQNHTQNTKTHRVDGWEQLEWMKESQLTYQPKINYLNWQPYISERMRAILLDWIQHVCEDFGFERETCYLAWNYLDRFLSAVPSIVRSKLQLVGATALFIATKIEETEVIPISELVDLSVNAFKENEVKLTEHIYLPKLNWKLNAVTVPSFLSVYFQILADPQTHKILKERRYENCENLSTTFARKTYVKAMQLLDLACLDQLSLKYLPAILTAAAFSLIHDNNETLVKVVTTYSLEELSSATKFLNHYVGQIHPLIPPFDKEGDSLDPSFYSKQFRNPYAVDYIRNVLANRAKKKQLKQVGKENIEPQLPLFQ